jgi:hypothetical protein
MASGVASNARRWHAPQTAPGNLMASPTRACVQVETTLRLCNAVLPNSTRLEIKAPQAARPATLAPRLALFRPPAQKADALFHGIATNHAFVDGNQRTALTAAIALCRLNGATSKQPRTSWSTLQQSRSPSRK